MKVVQTSVRNLKEAVILYLMRCNSGSTHVLLERSVKLNDGMAVPISDLVTVTSD
jgi:hypothetical protein